MANLLNTNYALCLQLIVTLKKYTDNLLNPFPAKIQVFYLKIIGLVTTLQYMNGIHLINIGVNLCFVFYFLNRYFQKP